MPSVNLTTREHETLLFAALDCAATSLEIARDKCQELRDVNPPPDAGLVQDTRSAIRLAREALDALDALGWPERERGRMTDIHPVCVRCRGEATSGYSWEEDGDWLAVCADCTTADEQAEQAAMLSARASESEARTDGRSTPRRDLE